MMSEKSSFNNC